MTILAAPSPAAPATPPPVASPATAGLPNSPPRVPKTMVRLLENQYYDERLETGRAAGNSNWLPTSHPPSKFVDPLESPTTGQELYEKLTEPVKLVVIMASVLMCARRTIPTLICQAWSKHGVEGRKINVNEEWIGYHYQEYMSRLLPTTGGEKGLSADAQGQEVMAAAIRYSVLKCRVPATAWQAVASPIISYVLDQLAQGENWQVDRTVKDFLTNMRRGGAPVVLLVDDPRITLSALRQLYLLPLFATPPVFAYNPMMSAMAITPRVLEATWQSGGVLLDEGVILLTRDVSTSKVALQSSIIPILYSPIAVTSHLDYSPLALCYRDTPTYDNILPLELTYAVPHVSSLRDLTAIIHARRHQAKRPDPDPKRHAYLRRNNAYPNPQPPTHKDGHHDAPVGNGVFLQAPPDVRRVGLPQYSSIPPDRTCYGPDIHATTRRCK